MGILSATIVQPILYAAYAVYVVLGIGAIVMGAIFTSKAGQTNIGVGILVVGAFMLVLGGIAAFATKSQQWMILFLVEIINVVLLVVLFVLSVQLMIIGTGRDDPITDGVREAWGEGVRADLESSSYCDNYGGDSCDEYYFYFKDRNDFTGDYYCPGIADEEEAFYAANCTKYDLVDASGTSCTALQSKCELCDDDCLEQFILDTQAYMGPVALTIWALFFFLAVEIVWNNITLEAAGDDFEVTGFSAIVSHLLNAVVFLFGFTTMILGLISMGLIKQSCPEGESCVGWTSTGLVFFGALIFLCAVLVSIAVWKDIAILMKIVDDILIILCFFLMLCAIPISMTAGLLTGVSDFYDSNYHTVRAELESYDASYCSYPEVCDKKEALKETCGADGQSKCCVTCDEKWAGVSSTAASCVDDTFFTTVQVEINNVLDLSSSAVIDGFDSADQSWISSCEGDEVDIICSSAIESITDSCAFNVQLDDVYVGQLDDSATYDIYGSTEYVGLLSESATSQSAECLFESTSTFLKMYGSTSDECENAEELILDIGTGTADYYRYSGSTRGVLVSSQNCDATGNFKNGRSGSGCSATAQPNEASGTVADVGLFEYGTGGYAKACGDSNTVKIVGGWENTNNLYSTTYPVNGICLENDVTTNTDCNDYDPLNFGDTSYVGECLVDITDTVFVNGANSASTCGDLCQLKGGKCSDEASDTASIPSSFTYEKDGDFVTCTGGCDNLGSFSEYECNLNRADWTSWTEMCETTSDKYFFTDTCSRVGLCRDICVEKNIDGTFPWEEISVENNPSSGKTLYTAAGCSADELDCVSKCEDYGTCRSNGEVDYDFDAAGVTSSDDDSNLGFCGWCNPETSGYFNCNANPGQISLRGLSFTSIAPFQASNGLITSSATNVLTVDLQADAINEYIDLETLIIETDGSTGTPCSTSSGSGSCLTETICVVTSGGDITLEADTTSCAGLATPTSCVTGFENLVVSTPVCYEQTVDSTNADLEESFVCAPDDGSATDFSTASDCTREDWVNDEGCNSGEICSKILGTDSQTNDVATVDKVVISGYSGSTEYVIVPGAYRNMYDSITSAVDSAYTPPAFFDPTNKVVSGGTATGFSFGSGITFDAIDSSDYQCTCDGATASATTCDGANAVVCAPSSTGTSGTTTPSSAISFTTLYSGSVETKSDCVNYQDGESTAQGFVSLEDLCGTALDIESIDSSTLIASDSYTLPGTDQYLNLDGFGSSTFSQNYFLSLEQIQEICLVYYREECAEEDKVDCSSSDTTKGCCPASGAQTTKFSGVEFKPIAVTDTELITGNAGVVAGATDCDEYVECGIEVGYTDEDDVPQSRQTVVIPTDKTTCDSVDGVVALSPNQAAAIEAYEKTEFVLDNYILATCDAELAAQDNSNVYPNVRYTDGSLTSGTNTYGPALQAAEDALIQGLYTYYCDVVPDGEEMTGVDCTTTLSVRDSSGSRENSYWSTKASSVIGEYWSTVQYCNELGDLAANMKTASDVLTSTKDRIEKYLTLADQYIVNNADFGDIFSNRTDLDAQYNPAGDAAELISKCALTLTSQSDFSEEGEDSVCVDLPELTDANAANDFDSTAAYLEYCQACENVDFLDIEGMTDDTKKCFSYLLVQYSLLASSSTDAGSCCTSLQSSDDNRNTLADAGVNVCVMTDEDCKSKVKRYIERNASPIGIIVFIEVVFMYVVVYLTQKAIKIFKDGDDDDDDDDDDDE